MIATLKCSICGEAASERYKPFCSRRCADVDLGRWLSGRYAIAGGNADADEDGDALAAELDTGEMAPHGREDG